MGFTVLLFATELQKPESAHHMHFLRFLREDWGEFQKACMWKGEESIKKSVFTEFTSRYHS